MALQSNQSQTEPLRARAPKPARILWSRPHLSLSAVLGLIATLCLPETLRLFTRLLIGWDLGIVIYFLLVFDQINQASHHEIRRRARELDEGKYIILFLTVLACCASFGAVTSELSNLHSSFGRDKIVIIGLTALTVILSWFLMNLSFSLHYAHEFYGSSDEDSNQEDTPKGGLRFPGTPEPQYLDFLYFAFVIGVSFQTGDIETRSAHMRGIALIQGILSFFFNAFVLALMVNIASQFS